LLHNCQTTEPKTSSSPTFLDSSRSSGTTIARRLSSSYSGAARSSPFSAILPLVRAQFDVVLELLRPDIQLQNTRWRSSIDLGQQLAITLRYSFLILFTFKIDSFLWHDAFAQRGLCRGKMSVRLSVSHTPVLSLNVIHILKVFFPPSGSPTFLVFPYQTGCQYSDRDPLTRASNARGYGKNNDFRPIPSFISELMQGRATVTTEGE